MPIQEEKPTILEFVYNPTNPQFSSFKIEFPLDRNSKIEDIGINVIDHNNNVKTYPLELFMDVINFLRSKDALPATIRCFDDKKTQEKPRSTGSSLPLPKIEKRDKEESGNEEENSNVNNNPIESLG